MGAGEQLAPRGAPQASVQRELEATQAHDRLRRHALFFERLAASRRDRPDGSQHSVRDVAQRGVAIGFRGRIRDGARRRFGKDAAVAGHERRALG